MGTRQALQKKLDACDEQRRELTAHLSQLGYIWHGSLLRRRLTCGKVGCACRRDPDARHGPYACWTTKVAGRTVSRLLPPLEATLYEEWIANRRALEETLVQLRALSVKAAHIILKLNSSESH